ncbi:MAG: sodium-dependent transporter [candidate division Zixibacteria bacterium]|nr:sodium-dependent transporter [candidate division Zixibacteria bacterium]
MAKIRERWSGRTAFLLSIIGSAVGLGNIWRFPYIAFKNGGGAFLIPYFLALFTAGIPLLILETGIGQKLQGSAADSFKKINKDMEWLGWLALLVGMIISTYYAVVIAWCWNYAYHSISLAWLSQGANDFFNNSVLQISSGPGQLGGIVWWVLLGLVLTWGAIWFIISRGVKWLGKYNQVMIPIALVMLLVLLFRGVTLEGAADGLGKFLTPDIGKLLDPNVWLAAYSQIFYTLSLGFGILITYASYRRRDEDVTNNALITGMSNSTVEFLAGITVFSTAGFLAANVGTSIEQMSISGPGLAFKTYPAAIGNLPHFAPFFGVLFFGMLLFLGTTSLISLIEAVVCGLRDKFGIGRLPATTLICLVGFAFGLLFATRAGLYWLDIIDHWTNSYGLTMVGLAECIIIGWFYKSKTLRDFANSVSEVRLGGWWDICIKYITPGVLIITVAYSLIQEFAAPYEGYTLWPRLAGGWFLITVIIIIAIVLMKTKSPESRAHGPAVVLFLFFGMLSMLAIFNIDYLGIYSDYIVTTMNGFAESTLETEQVSGMSASSWIILLIGLTILLGTLFTAIRIAFASEKRKRIVSQK